MISAINFQMVLKILYLYVDACVYVWIGGWIRNNKASEKKMLNPARQRAPFEKFLILLLQLLHKFEIITKWKVAFVFHRTSQASECSRIQITTTEPTGSMFVKRAPSSSSLPASPLSPPPPSSRYETKSLHHCYLSFTPPSISKSSWTS